MTVSRPTFVLGVDSGGSGLRVALTRATPDGMPSGDRDMVVGEPVRTGPAGVDAAHLTDQLLPAARALLRNAEAGERIAAVCVGAAGMATLGAHLRAELPGLLSAALGVERLALAADAVTAYAGALGERPGVVVAAGTGVIALGTDLREWRRADGWGHLLGDCGGGAWIGRAGLDAALRAHDGREGGSPALLAAAEQTFGPIEGLPQQLYPRADRAALLASFAPAVARCATAGTGDPVAQRILWQAGEEIARTVAAAWAGPAGDMALTGGLCRIGEPLLAPLRAACAARLPHAVLVPAVGDPLHGALLIAARLTAGSLRLPVAPGLLNVG